MKKNQPHRGSSLDNVSRKQTKNSTLFPRRLSSLQGVTIESPTEQTPLINQQVTSEKVLNAYVKFSKKLEVFYYGASTLLAITSAIEAVMRIHEIDNENLALSIAMPIAGIFTITAAIRVGAKAYIIQKNFTDEQLVQNLKHLNKNLKSTIDAPNKFYIAYQFLVRIFGFFYPGRRSAVSIWFELSYYPSLLLPTSYSTFSINPIHERTIGKLINKTTPTTQYQLTEFSYWVTQFLKTYSITAILLIQIPNTYVLLSSKEDAAKLSSFMYDRDSDFAYGRIAFCVILASVLTTMDARTKLKPVATTKNTSKKYVQALNHILMSMQVVVLLIKTMLAIVELNPTAFAINTSLFLMMTLMYRLTSNEKFQELSYNLTKFIVSLSHAPNSVWKEQFSSKMPQTSELEASISPRHTS